MQEELIAVDLTLGSRLDFSKKKEEITTTKTPFFFELQLGLFDQLPLPLSDEGQWQSLALGVHCFVEALLPIRRSQGVILYRGPVDLSLNYPYKEGGKFSCQETCASFLRDLLSLLPEEIIPYLYFERQGKEEELRLLSSDFFSPFSSIISPPFPFEKESPIALFLPSAHLEEGWKETMGLMHALEDLQIPFKTVSETALTYSWENIEVLVVAPEAVTLQGRRKLEGFAAAEGEILFIRGSPDDRAILRLREISLHAFPAALQQRDR